MDCKHELKMLVGMADGIHCTGCGRIFKTLEEIPTEDYTPEPKKKRRKKDAE